MKAKRILMVLTSHENLGISGKKTGNWFDELATPYYKFKEARLDVSITSPKGGAVPIDPFSYEEAFMSDSAQRLAADAAAQRALTNALRFADIDVDDYAGVFFPGGYGQLWDLASDSRVIRSIERWLAAKKPVAMVCHAPAILRDAKKPNGEPLVQDMNVTGFTDAEDQELGLARHLLFSLERALTVNGANFNAPAKTGSPTWWRMACSSQGRILRQLLRLPTRSSAKFRKWSQPDRARSRKTKGRAVSRAALVVPINQ